MKSSDIIETVRTLIRTPLRNASGRVIVQPFMIKASPGTGKSACVHQACGIEGATIYDRRAALLDPVETGGLPIVTKDQAMAYARAYILPPAGETAPCALFLDELDKAVPVVQNALLGLVLDREIHGHKLPESCRIIACVNKMTDRAHSQKLSTALNSRFVHAELDIDIGEWSRWANGVGIRQEVIAFTRFHQQSFYNFDPNATTFPCPRTWEMVSNVLDQQHGATRESELILGTVDQGAGAEFLGFLRVWRNLPSPDSILLNPTTAPVPEDPATLYAISGTLAMRANAQNFGAIVTYLNRLPPEFGVFAVSSAVRRAPEVQTTRGFIQWSSDNSDVLF